MAQHFYQEKERLMRKTINRKLQAARKAKCWSLEDAAREVRVSVATFCRWEHYQQMPHPSSMALLCKAFNVATPRDLGFYC